MLILLLISLNYIKSVYKITTNFKLTGDHDAIISRKREKNSFRTATYTLHFADAREMVLTIT